MGLSPWKASIASARAFLTSWLNTAPSINVFELKLERDATYVCINLCAGLLNLPECHRHSHEGVEPQVPNINQPVDVIFMIDAWHHNNILYTIIVN